MSRLAFLQGMLLAPVAAQSTGLVTLFLPDSEPLSLDASAVGVSTVGRDPVTTWKVACPTGASPEDEACRAAGIYPAQVYHTQGSVWGGTTTYSADDSTTTWVCTLGGSNPTLSGECTKTIVRGRSTRSETATYDNCYVAAHQRPIMVTAGLDKISYYQTTIEASDYVSMRSSQLSEDGCPSSKAIIWEGAVTSSSTITGSAGHGTAHATASSTLTGGSGTAPTAPATVPTQTGTSSGSAPASTTSPNGAGTGGQVHPMAALSLGMGVILIAGLVF
ncbi:hypothetical protein MYCTH_2307800 [Thermothelomyces thermophilus ATCC 42464]|uniref:Ig-like domain-containing protein n=1 Tax=Thermothelomyces thermophilus (strain ATCC 42464 / BCRC 31852 / DSM 1799) TaxID=573729 RepID=G2QGU9_THET4|nr:uncharacterized protein MYCTH_2307800 [Thermothelomyces thermophilus ATCC 42464]AEO59456.1 hypothetical protein MYCTH_2307800 [Thermothelomyces thermophilus ATCC 42464]